MELKVEKMQELQPIKFNYEEIKQQLKEKLKNYDNIVYTEETISMAKTDRATLNKVKKAINDEKIRIKNYVLTDYITNFEPKTKELMEMIENVANKIDTQIKTFEIAEQNKKTEEIKAIYNAYIGNYKDLIPFERIFNDRWLNKTYTMKKITEDINHIIVKTSDDMNVLEGQLQDENVLNQVKNYYFLNITESDVLSKALTQGMKIVENNKKLEELKAQQEATKQVEIPKKVDNEVKQQEDLQVIDFRVWVTQEQKMKIREFLIQNNIRYGKV